MELNTETIVYMACTGVLVFLALVTWALLRIAGYADEQEYNKEMEYWAEYNRLSQEIGKEWEKMASGKVYQRTMRWYSLQRERDELVREHNDRKAS